MSVYDANSYWCMSYGYAQGERCLPIPARLSAFPEPTSNTTSSHLVVVPLDHIHVRRDGAQILVRLSIAYISCAQYLLDLPRYEQFLEFSGEVVDAVWDVQVADNENENHSGGECGGC